MKRYLLVIVCVSYGFLSNAAPSVDKPEPAPDTAAALRLAVGELRPRSFHFGPPFNLSPDLTPKVCAARERIVRYTKSHTGPDLDREWFIAAEDSFVLSSITEWNQYPLAEEALLNWWTILEGTRSEDKHLAANLSLRMASYHLQNWIKIHPQECLEILKEAETQFFMASSAGEQSSWKWWVARFAELFQGAAGRVPEPGRAAFLNEVGRLLDQSVADETMALHTRTFTVTNQARNLYAQGKPQQAVALLEAWWQKHGEKIHSPDFYAVRFFVAYLGQGDRPTAARMVEKATRLVADSAFLPREGNYTGMIDAYYARLALTDDELKRQAQLFMKERGRLTQ